MRENYIVELRGVTKSYSEDVGVFDITIKIPAGDFVFLIGPTGAGKTTISKLILKEIQPDEGKVFLDGIDITNAKRRDIPGIRQKIGMVFQDFRLLEKKTVYENVSFAMEILHKSKLEIRSRVPYVLNLVEIANKAKRYPCELSAGEQQRVGIARAIVNNPRILICDEPTGNLDPITAMDIMRLLEQINNRGTTILMVTHAKDIVDQMQKRVIAINGGRIIRDAQGDYSFYDEENEKKEINSVIDALAEENLVLTPEERVTLYRAQLGADKKSNDTSVDELLKEYLDG